MKSRGKVDSTLAAMFSNVNYSADYLFYAHLIGQCSIKIYKELPAPAGVSFSHDHYNLYINPDGIYVPWDDIKDKISPEKLKKITDDMFKTDDGVKLFQFSKGFDEYDLHGRLAILKHEMLHILLNHIDREGKRDHKLFNIAADCAENQFIDLDHLPDDAILPKNLGDELEISVPENKSAEYYYDLIKKEAKKKNGQGGKNSNSGGLEKLQEQLLDSHDTWTKSEYDPDLKKALTKKMIQKSEEETIKSAGTVPSSCSDWLELHSSKAEVNWRQVLRRIVGNKRVGKRQTIMRKNRRFPNREDLRGTTKNRTFSVLCIADVSGSMSSKAITETMGEVKHICDITKSDMDLIQIDTEAHEPEKIGKKTKYITRKSSGGTELFPAIEKAKQHNLDFQAIVILTDGYLFSNEVQDFRKLNKKVIWLIEKDGQIMDGMDSGKMKAFKLK